MQPDSIVLERTLCYGTCPAYRLRLGASGHVQFRSRNPGQEGTIHSDGLPGDGFRFLTAMAERIGFFDLPDRIDESTPTYCPDYATDHPTVTVTVFGRAWRKRVEHYTGCYSGLGEHTPVEPLIRLRQFHSAIDSVAGSSRWARPARIR